jgi:hypothetical protein
MACSSGLRAAGCDVCLGAHREPNFGAVF